MNSYRLIPLALELIGDAPRELQVVDAVVLVARQYPALATDRPALIWSLDRRTLWTSLANLLCRAYGPGHEGVLGTDLGTARPTRRTLRVGDLGTVAEGTTGFFYLPPLSFAATVETFQDTVARLRGPGGCPWDREQTHRSLRQGFQEEAYEVLDALDRGDVDALKEELGDILLHILLQVQIAQEADEFRLCDVVHSVNEKIVYRHPHVFDGLVVDGVQDVLTNWEILKQQEKESRIKDASALDGIAPTMPALARAQSIQRHVDGSGLVESAADGLAIQAVESINRLLSSNDHAIDARILGDLLFDLANLARLLGIDAESALREANLRFEKRFQEFEQRSS
jgi:tetrapyrrole methylase family protein/MazG family protein